MSNNFKKLKLYAPEKCLRDGIEHDPLILIDTIVAGGDLTKQQTIKEADKIDWLPEEVKQLVDAHCREDDDVDMKENINKERLMHETKSLFQNARTKICFVNFYQLKQFALRFAMHWGFHLSTQAGSQIKCFFVKSTTKTWDPVESASKQQSQASLKSGCAFVIRASFDPQFEALPCHWRATWISNMILEHDEQCLPGIAELCMAKKSAGVTIGSLDLLQLALIVE